MSYQHTCIICDSPYEAKVPHQNYCSPACRNVSVLRKNKERNQSLTVEEWQSRKRYCLWCGMEFQLRNKDANNTQYCSSGCRSTGYKQRQAEFYERNPGIMKQYNRKRVETHGRKTLLLRLYKRFPDLPTACESCGESRVLDLAHKPEHARNGAARTLRLYQRHMFWVLCPTCHALLDRLKTPPDNMGLIE